MFDDVAGEIYYAQLLLEEETKAVMAATRELVHDQGVFVPYPLALARRVTSCAHR